MFGWLKRRAHPHHRQDDAVWMSDAARLDGVLALACELQARGEAVVLASHSPIAARALADKAEQVGQELPVLETHQLKPTRLAEQARGAQSLTVLMVGASTDPQGEEKLLLQCKDLPFRIELQLHYSMDDLVKSGFATPSLQSMLEKLGLRQNESIVHPFVSRALAKAREKAATGQTKR